VGDGLSVASKNRREDAMAWDTRRDLPGCFMPTGGSRTRVSQSSLKTGGGATVGGAHGNIADVASRSSRIQTGQCDGLRRTLLSLLCRFGSVRP
jgi:hypothetical protein